MLEIAEGIGQGPPHVGLDLGENLTEQRKPPLALEALEVGGPEDLGVVAIREILKKIPTALKQAQATADASFKPQLNYSNVGHRCGGGSASSSPPIYNGCAQKVARVSTRCLATGRASG